MDLPEVFTQIPYLDQIINSTLFRNSIGLVVISLIWLIFSVVGLRGLTIGHRIKEVRQETGLSLLTLAIFTLGVLGFIAFYLSSQNSPTSK